MHAHDCMMTLQCTAKDEKFPIDSNSAGFSTNRIYSIFNQTKFSGKGGGMGIASQLKSTANANNDLFEYSLYLLIN